MKSVLTKSNGYLILSFELLGAGAAAVTASTGAAQILAASSAISRSGAGVFVITLAKSYNKLVEAAADVDDSLDDGAYATIGTVTNEGTSTALQFTLRFRNAGGTKADPAAARRIWVQLVLREGTGSGES